MRRFPSPELSRASTRVMVLALLVCGWACRVSLSPLQNRIRVGEDSYLIFVGDGEGGVGDLFAVHADGGAVYPLTYTRLDESLPAISPDGRQVVFLRARPSDPPAAAGRGEAYVTTIDLENGSERVLFRARPPVRVLALGWSRDGDVLIETPAGILRAPVPPSSAVEPVTALHSGEADSSLRVFVGDPPFAEVRVCDAGDERGLCVALPDGDLVPLVADGHDAVRWGPDSLAYVIYGEVEVRPVGKGTARRLLWSGAPASPRHLTFFAGR